MNKFNISVAQARSLHEQGKAAQLHGIFETGMLKAAVFGANDGIITTFAVVAGVAGAQLSPSIIVILGVANMIADGISMGLGDYLGERSELKHRRYQFEIEKWEIANIPEEETKELALFFKKRGVTDAEAKKLIEIIKKYPDMWSEFGFVDEMGVAPRFDEQIWKTGLMTFVAFVFAGLIPLLPYISSYLGFSPFGPQQFVTSIFATGIGLFLIGSARTFVTKGTWWLNGLEMLGIGTLAALSAYFVGGLLEKFIL